MKTAERTEAGDDTWLCYRRIEVAGHEGEGGHDDLIGGGLFQKVPSGGEIISVSQTDGGDCILKGVVKRAPQKIEGDVNSCTKRETYRTHTEISSSRGGR